MSKGLIWGFLASQCRLLTVALASGFQLYKENFDSSKVPVDLETLLQRARSQSRVNIILTGTLELRKIMAQASRLNMTNGEFVFLYILPPRGPGFLPIVMEDGLGNNTDTVYDAYQSLITVNFPVPHFAELSNFIQLTERIAKSMYGKVFDFNDKNNEILTAVPEMVLTIGQVLSGGKTPLDNLTTRQFLEGFIGREFLNQDFLPVYLGANGIRIVDSVFNKLNSTLGTFCPAWKYKAAVRNLTRLSSLADQWKGSKGPPLNEPFCGFRNNRCDGYGSQTVLAGAIVAGLGVVVITAVVVNIKHVSTTDHSCLQDLEPMLFTLDSCNTAADLLSAVYNEEKVLAHELASECVGNVTSSGQMPRLLKQLCTMRHTNIGQFYGIVKQPVPCGCYETACTVYAVWMHGRGTLREIFESQVIAVDGAMKFNFIFDVLTGLHFIHTNTLLKIHGSLSTSTVILDSRLTAKICDVGSNEMKCAIKRLGSTGLTAVADIASLGGVFHEILLDQVVSSQDTVQAGSTKSGSETFRSTLLDIVQQCQSADPDTRPTTKAIWTRLRTFREESTLVEIMLNRLEEHARNLETVVSERTADLIAERANVDKLLSAMIPPSLITQLRRKDTVLPETFSSATIYFSSMIGFDALCTSRQPDEVRTYLNELYRLMDNQIAGFNVYKVETINDSYMVASGVPVRNGDQHVDEIASMALHVAKGCSVNSLTHFLPIRIGMHTGPVVASVVGVRMPRYCLFGDTINTASRMESHGEASRIHVSPDTAQLLTHRQDIRLHSRGQIVVKGKGVIETFWLSEEGTFGPSLTENGTVLI